MNNRLIIFDLMRSLAIFIILFHHLPGYLYVFLNPNFVEKTITLYSFHELSRYLGLGLFIFITGYLLKYRTERFQNKSSAFDFLYKKIIRIFPLYYLALIAFIYMYKLFSPIQIGVHLLGLQLLFASPTNEPIMTLWFIGLIAIYYCLFIAINFSFLTNLHRILIIILFPILIGILALVFEVTDLRILLYYWVFIFGVFSAEINFFERPIWRKISPATPFLFILVLFVSFWVEKEYGLGKIDLKYSYILINLLELLFVLFVYYLSSLISIKQSFLKLIRLISYSSYCIFLFHRPIWFIMSNFLQNTLEIKNIYIIGSILIVIGIPLLIMFSYFLQRLYDLYIMKLELATRS